MPDAAPRPRHATRHESAWGFAVFEVATDKVVEVDGIPQTGMLRQEADRLAEQLNRNPGYKPSR